MCNSLVKTFRRILRNVHVGTTRSKRSQKNRQRETRNKHIRIQTSRISPFVVADWPPQKGRTPTFRRILHKVSINTLKKRLNGCGYSLQGVGDRPYPAYASTLWQVGQLIPTEEHKMQAGFMLCGYFRLWWAIAHYKTIFRFGKIEIR